ncbi:acrylyl-CoA reductase (NADPH) [Paracoccus denitrificans]|jgi:acrylyl-CoA reductase (NADPH)|uniref:Alcohol dehydrogenase GroES domain protein n=1 Tax=Paracoccus denitrificans (strain Pd 1222) TaxID=318586 RepID=A1BC07_PARDP|nr:MDR family oxidoreductase [Paracoccus denitrificans]ABL73051.1 Alcohol dehydrogenase GroES domain protein [Paracoccus denitrificans PD1222]MBB4628426.1 acrylyl-CoA reductase (NADPH) [Paracoccus denitrificans]MCU7429637.1 oxidoreductase [Paracoccus denitrificans]QAR29443.1 oxidoreductase [Paracoccus denitrificans]UPV98229.1 oxidoreductase [Paracoccus denitrificans]
MFDAILIDKDESGYSARLAQLDDDALPEGDLTVAVEWSTMNYKDALALTGKSPVVRRFPMVPGIDFAGTVVQSGSDAFRPGDKVVHTGFGMGETRWGGYAERMRVASERTLKLPEGLDTRQAMAIGTAGFTAMLCVLALERHGVKPGDGDVLVTGATGGVGSFAVKLLAGRGYRVVAATGKASEADYLTGLGAAEILDRAELSAPGKPLGRERWIGAVDAVGGVTLANVCAGTKYGGTVAACGLAESMEFPATVAPFILRGVTLAGIDSVFCPMALRARAWKALAKEVEARTLEQVATEIALAKVLDRAPDLLAGKVRGRLIVNVRDG